MNDAPKKSDQEIEPFTVAGLRIDVLDEAFSWYIRSIDAVVSRDLDQRTAHLDVAKGKGKITTLLLVAGNPGIRPSQIAEVLLRDRPATGRIIDHLVKAGDIYRKTDTEDQRAQALYITEKGSVLAQEVRDIIRAQENDFFDFIPDEDRAEFMRVLKRAYINMRTKLE